MRADNSAHLLSAARRRSEHTLDRARQALRELESAGASISMSAVATRAGVSRAWLYTQTELRQQIDAKRGAAPPRPAQLGAPASEASLRQRLTLAHERIRELADDNADLRHQIAQLHGQLRAAKLGDHSRVTDTVHDTNAQVTTLTDQDHRR
jgi:hypothetical protein